MATMNPSQQTNNRKPTVQMPLKQVRDEDDFTQSFVAMLNVMRRIYELGGDPGIKTIIDKAERALGRR
jgi:hypothetical protein